jgi:hypothetical protein
MASLQEVLARYGFDLISKAEWDQEADDGRGIYRIGFDGPTIWMARAKSVTPRGILTALAEEFGYLEYELKLAAKEELTSEVETDEPEDDRAFIEPIDVVEVMDRLGVPIDVEPVWDDEEAVVRFDVTLASDSFISLWPHKNTPDGIALELAAEFERIAHGIREAVERRRVPTNRDCDTPAVA